MSEWQDATPEIDREHEFFEIANDFADPLEAVREAISNAHDWNAKNVRIEFKVEQVEGAPNLVAIFSDDGDGMSEQAVAHDFWGLGMSAARQDPTKIGEKGHGTKIFFRSEVVKVKTLGPEGAYEAICVRPFRSLTSGHLHKPKFRRIPPEELKTDAAFTEIQLVGYNSNDMARFTQAVLRDYILWFTKAGAVDREFDGNNPRPITVHLKGLDVQAFESLPSGHVFAKETPDIQTLFDKHGVDAADFYVKRYRSTGRLRNRPDVAYEAVVYVEGDKAKREYNPMIKDRIRKGSDSYRVSDRYGIWLCKDYIPVCRQNDWITGFGNGSNAFVLLHGFVNCQNLRLTANRGNVANTDPAVMEGLREVVTALVDQIDGDLRRADLFTLMNWQEELQTVRQEENEFRRRTSSIKKRKRAQIAVGQEVLEPQNEAELMGLFMRVYALHPDYFEFEPLDYNTARGIDLIGCRKSPGNVNEPDHWYVEFKHILGARPFNHAFRNLRWIVCWDFDSRLKDGDEFSSIEEADRRTLQFPQEGQGADSYFLDSGRAAVKIQVIRFRDFLVEKMGVKFEPPKRP
jgi:hypothetical protein